VNVSFVLFRNQLGLLVRDRLTRTVDGVRSREEFRKALARERAGSDRNEHGFSLLVFDGGFAGNPAGVREFARVLTRRIRQNDEIGWFDQQRLGVLLPYTSASGAKTLAADLCPKIGPSAGSCTIYTYPSKWFPDEGDGKTAGSDKAGARGLASPEEGSTLGRGRRGGLFTRRVPTWKRAVDIVGSLIALIFLSPIFLLAAIVIKVASPGPVFYKQERVGRNGKLFRMWKFRTMHVDADSTLHQNHLSSLITMDSSMTKLDALRDPRIVPFGNIMRRSYLDELPQLINVLRGEMSLVGPRPCIPYEAQEYRLWQTKRFDTLPGMTGLWQVSGKNKTTFKEMIRFDIAYSRQCSFWLDVGVLLKTVPAIVAEILDGVSKTAGHIRHSEGEMK
jgi:lipopolysaccharide/colanic/teichoic acid biosynthesis glycosyltransferase